MGKLMNGLVAGLMVVGLLAVATPVSAGHDIDPLRIGFFKSGEPGTPAALEGGYQTGGGLFQFLMIAAPQDCVDGSDPVACAVSAHLWFYNQACTRVDDKAVPLTKNDLEVLALHDPLVTANRVGNVLVAATLPTSAFGQVRMASNAIIGQTWFVDAVRGIGRIEDMATLAGEDGPGWMPYRPAHVLLFAPPDDGVVTTGTLIFRCPQGTALQAKALAGLGSVVGTFATLGGDMLDLASQSEGNAPGSAVNAVTTAAFDDTLCDNCTTNGLFAKAISAIVYNDTEDVIKSVDNISCRCLGASIAGGAFVNEIRLGDIALQAKSQTTYWEIFSFGSAINIVEAGTTTQELWTAALNVVARSGAQTFNFYTRLFSANTRDNIEP